MSPTLSVPCGADRLGEAAAGNKYLCKELRNSYCGKNYKGERGVA